MAEILNYAVGLCAMVYALTNFKRKLVGQPQLKIAGLSLKTLITMCYIGIAAFALLIVMKLMD